MKIFTKIFNLSKKEIFHQELNFILFEKFINEILRNYSSNGFSEILTELVPKKQGFFRKFPKKIIKSQKNLRLNGPDF